MLAIITRADQNISKISEISHPLIKKYANKCKADFIVLSKDYEGCQDRMGRIHYRILEAGELLSTYDRVLSLDTDVLITDDCPNLFSIVPVDYIGSIFEDRGRRQLNRIDRIRKVQAAFGYVGWDSGYINTGVFMVSRCHKEIFYPEKLWLDEGYDDVLLGWELNKRMYPVHILPFCYNHMSMFSEVLSYKCGAPSRYTSYIIHYAGNGRFPGTDRMFAFDHPKRVPNLMKYDLEELRRQKRIT